MVRTHVWGSALAIAVASASPVHAVILPAAGMYQVNEFTTAVSGGVNGECDPWGPANSPATPAFFHYLGPSQPSAWQRAPNIGPDSSFVYTLYFPKTPAKRVTSWSGIYQATFPPLRLLLCTVVGAVYPKLDVRRLSVIRLHGNAVRAAECQWKLRLRDRVRRSGH